MQCILMRDVEELRMRLKRGNQMNCRKQPCLVVDFPRVNALGES